MPPSDPLDLAKEILGGHVAHGLCPSLNVTRQLLTYVQVARQNARPAQVRCPEHLHSRRVEMSDAVATARAFLERRSSITPEQVAELAAMVLATSAVIETHVFQNRPVH